tara:strand:+ start:303 stop:488 length:186 start_codon:yes stop_codon:yes gene_type:complete
MKTSLLFSFLFSLNLNRPKSEYLPHIYERRAEKLPNKKVNLKLFFLIKSVDFISFFVFFWG